MKRLIECSECNGIGLDCLGVSDCEACYGWVELESDWEEEEEEEGETIAEREAYARGVPYPW